MLEKYSSNSYCVFIKLLQQYYICLMKIQHCMLFNKIAHCFLGVKEKEEV